LTAHLFRRLAEIPELKILSPQPKADGRSALASFTAGEVHPHDLSTILDERHCDSVWTPLHSAATSDLDIFSRARVSLYFYNTREEIDTFLVVLKAAIAFFG
jgi:cysteine desulfurase / selenocysteine lyase